MEELSETLQELVAQLQRISDVLEADFIDKMNQRKKK